MTEIFPEDEGAPDAPPPKLRAHTASGLLWSGSAMAAQVLLNVVSISILARILTPHDYGLVSAVMMVVELSATFAAFGLNPALVQRKTLQREHVETASAVSIMLGLFFAASLWLSAPLVAGWMHIPELRGLIQALAWVVLLQVFIARAEALLARRLQFRLISMVKLGAWLVGTFGIVIPAALMGFGYKSLIAGSIAQLLITSGAYAFFGRNDLAPPRFSGRAFRELVGVGAGFSATELFNYIASYSDNITVGRALGPSSLAIYGRAYQLISMPTMLLGNLSRSVVFPAMSKVQDEPQRLRSALLTGLSLVAAVTLPASAFLSVFAPELVHILLGSRWTAVTTPFVVFAWVIYPRVGYKTAAVVLQAKGRGFTVGFVQGLYAALVAVGAALSASHGVGGVSLAVAGAILISFVVCLTVVLPIAATSVADFLAIHLRPLATAAVVAAIGIGVKSAMPTAGAVPLVGLGAVLCGLVLGSVFWFRVSLLLGPSGAAVAADMAGPLGRKIGWRPR